MPQFAQSELAELGLKTRDSGSRGHMLNTRHFLHQEMPMQIEFISEVTLIKEDFQETKMSKAKLKSSLELD